MNKKIVKKRAKPKATDKIDQIKLENLQMQVDNLIEEVDLLSHRVGMLETESNTYDNDDML